MTAREIVQGLMRVGVGAQKLVVERCMPAAFQEDDPPYTAYRWPGVELKPAEAR